MPENNLGPKNSSLENATAEKIYIQILSGWLGEQFYLPYQMLSCISLIQSVAKAQNRAHAVFVRGSHVCQRDVVLSSGITAFF